jgi:membrane-bound lytic murein transglycosylase D
MRTTKTSAVFAIFMGISIISCTNPNLGQPPAEEVTKPQFSDSSANDGQGSAPLASMEEGIYLESTEQSPYFLTDSAANVNDISPAVDDEIWRHLNLAFEYYSMGMLANKEAAWEEAQYYFEKCITILGELDLDPESATPEAAKYNQLLAELATGYRHTLLSLGHLPEDVSSDALISRFSEINHLKMDTTEFRRIEQIAQEKVAYDVPIIMNERVKNCILYYQTVARDAFEKHLSRSTKFLPLFRKVFKEHGLPEDMAYLAAVESGYSPNAYSWARAMGLWQFIASTGKLYGLDRNWWVDERKDPIKSTHAAARFLKDLYNEFGSWELAMAGYNGGPGRVRRTIRDQKTTDFWKMNLRKQTEDYVPFFMAATIISKSPEKFGFTDIDYQPEWVYDEVKVNKCLDLKIVAKELGCSLQDLKDLNPELLRNFTPPDVKEYTLRVPLGSRERFLAAYDNIPSSRETSLVQHTIKKGETISTIARSYGVSQNAILQANNLSNHAKIYTGKTLLVPVPNDSRMADKSQPKREFQADGNFYYVRSGDTVWDIARAFGTTAEKIRRLNNLDQRASIHVGQKLKIFETGTVTASKPDKDETVPAKTDSPPKETTTYKVKKGDTLWDIANMHGTTIARIRQANGLSRSSRIYPGQNLMIPSSQSESFKIYTIRRGDTLTKIAYQNRTTVSKLMAWNGLTDPELISIGDRLKIYYD